MRKKDEVQETEENSAEIIGATTEEIDQ